jgi:ATP-dependent DNA helicase DinG
MGKRELLSRIESQHPAVLIGFTDNSGALCASNLLKLVENTFDPGGWLQSGLAMEHRPQQSQMAIHVAQSMTMDDPVLFEAGTGVGKSLAYLIPGILHSITNERKMVVSSHTISLQEQILHKDLETCRLLFSQVPELEKYRDFKATLLIGKGNYLCPHRLQRAIRDKTDLFESSTTRELERIAEWAKTTQTGVVQELYPQPQAEIWDWLNADSTQCNRRHCSPDTCFYQKAKDEVNRANVIIINHALLFSLLGAGLNPGRETRGILYPDDFLVLDEAHTVPDIATDHFGLSVTRVGVRRLLTQLFNPKTNKGLLTRYHQSGHYNAVVKALEIADDFFDQIQFQYLSERSIVRLHKPAWVENLMLLPMQKIADVLGSVAQREQDEQAENELADYRKRVLSYNKAISSAIDLEEQDHVYWIERAGKMGSNTSIRSAPVDVAPYLRDCLFQRKTSCTLTSATLQDADGMDRFAQRCGAGGADFNVVTSPFVYEQQMAINIASDCPPLDPEHKTMEQEFLCDNLTFCASRVKGGTMALFTSYKEMNLVANKISKAIQKQGRKLYVQGEGLSRSQLVTAFKKDGNAVLFGTDSFWTGVDLPGAALSQVILVRIPFENPSHPIISARSDRCIALGEKPFFSLTLPAAQIKFRQGLGRLIRNQTDRGVLTILDSRVLKKTYGHAFLSMLPHKNYGTFTRLNRNTRFRGVPEVAQQETT